MQKFSITNRLNAFRTVLVLVLFSLCISIGFSSFYTPVNRDPELLLKGLKAKFNSVKDYSADVVIKVKVDFLKVPVTKAKIYYKAPNKIKVDAQGFAMLPRNGLDFANTSMLNGPYTAIYVKDEMVKGVNCAIVKVIPNDGGEVVISTMWIDPTKNELKKFTTTTKANGTFDVQLSYDPKKPSLVMPTQLLISFDVDKIQLPKGVSGDLTGESAHTEKADKSKSTRGQIIIDYANYKINQGLKDALFVEKKK